MTCTGAPWVHRRGRCPTRLPTLASSSPTPTRSRATSPGGWLGRNRVQSRVLVDDARDGVDSPSDPAVVTATRRDRAFRRRPANGAHDRCVPVMAVNCPNNGRSTRTKRLVLLLRPRVRSRRLTSPGRGVCRRRSGRWWACGEGSASGCGCRVAARRAGVRRVRWVIHSLGRPDDPNVGWWRRRQQLVDGGQLKLG